MASFSQKDIKLLWGRSGNRCAICKTELTQDKNAKSSSLTLGEQAHIIGEKENAPRGKSSLTTEERNCYHNLILLCPNHHTEIDKNECDWPIEKLHKVKSEHELWVNETLSKTTDQISLAKQVAVTSIIDSAVDLCHLEEWNIWTSWALSAEPHWDKDMLGKIQKFREKVVAAIWPEDCNDLKRATITFSYLLKDASDTFMQHAILNHGEYRPYKFYKVDLYNPNYDRDLKKYDEWLDACRNSMIEASKAANWFADIVRRDINPMFFAESGKFLITEGPFENMRFQTYLIEFDETETQKLPQSLFTV